MTVRKGAIRLCQYSIGSAAIYPGEVVAQRAIDLEEAALEAEKAFRIASLGYEEGEEDLLSVLTIQQRVISTKSALSSVERFLLEQRINLNLALGGSWES